MASLALAWALACVHYSVHNHTYEYILENNSDLQIMSFFGSNITIKVFSFKQSIHFLEPDVKKAKHTLIHTFDHESFGILPCFFKLHTYLEREAAGESSCSRAFLCL